MSDAGHGAVEHLDVVVVGAGLSGIAAGHHLQASCAWADYAILEARDAIGGTWDLFRYPGVRSDSDMYTLGYSFRPWTADDAIASGGSILDYVTETARVEGIDRHIRFGRRVVAADWSSAEARWRLTVEDVHTGETHEMTCSFLFCCGGYYRYDHGYQPDFAGADDFAGPIVHPQHWPEDLDCAGRRVVVIGSGATAVTLVPALAERGATVTMLQRSPTYVASLPGRNRVAGAIARRAPGNLGGSALRWANAVGTQAFYRLSKRHPAVVRRALLAGVRRQLPDGFDVDTHFTPRYDPWDERMCLVPDGDLFRAIRRGDVTVVTDEVDRFTTDGIRLASGAEIDADVIVTATGLELLFVGGIDLRVDGEPVDLPDTLVYKGMMLEGVPNLAVAIGYTNASWTLKCELTCRYVCRLLGHLRERGLRQATPVNDDPDVTPAPLLDLASGYIRRSVHRFPQQGSRFPWQVHQSYLRDYHAMRVRPVADRALRLSNPVPATGPGLRGLAGDDATRPDRATVGV